MTPLPFLLLLLAGPAATEERFKVIVNASNPVSQVSREQVALLFVDRTARWKDREAAPVDQSLRSPIREAFSEEILQQPLSVVRQYWEHRMITARELPPPAKASDEDVIAHVAKKSGGIGYVSPSTPLPDTVKVITILK